MHAPKFLIYLTILLVLISMACMGGAAVPTGQSSLEQQPQVTCFPLNEKEVTRLVEVTKVVEVTRLVEITRDVVATVEVEATTLIEMIVTATPQVPLVQFKGPSMFLVGPDIEAGTYKIEGNCNWQRLSCLDGSFGCVIAFANVRGQGYVTILESDKAFNAEWGDCTFTKTE